uniref:DDE Tnp4 domain-containing protein n=1 Tax=Haemonchus contortus TaxID=6289 RepID=A0A7I4Z453_HAECO
MPTLVEENLERILSASTELPGRNSRGETLAQFCERTRLSVANTYFQKRLGRRWTYHTPNRQMFHEIDFILTNCLRLFHNVGVIGESRFNIGSDHRLVRATIAIKPKEERKRLAAYHSKRIRYELNEETLKTLAATVDFTGGSGNVHTRYEKVTSAIRTVVKDASQRVRSKPRERLSEVTLQMLATRKEVGKTMTPVARTVLNKAIRVRVKNDYREYAARRAREAAEKATSIKRAFISTRLKTTHSGMPDESGWHCPAEPQGYREEIRTFFQDLFSSKVHVEAYSEPPEGENDNKEEWRVLESEVMQAIRQMKSGKAPGPDPNTARTFEVPEGSSREAFS